MGDGLERNLRGMLKKLEKPGEKLEINLRTRERLEEKLERTKRGYDLI